jgi:hypothetical protein
MKPASGRDLSRKESKINNQKVELQPLKFGWFSLPGTEPEFVSSLPKTNALNFFSYYSFFLFTLSSWTDIWLYFLSWTFHLNYRTLCRLSDIAVVTVKKSCVYLLQIRILMWIFGYFNILEKNLLLKGLILILGVCILLRVRDQGEGVFRLRKVNIVSFYYLFNW